MYPVLTKRAAQLRVDERYETARGETARLQDQMERLRSCLRIAVIFGGDKAAPGSVLYKTSNTRSWKSYEAVAQDIADSLARIGFRNVQLLPEDMHLGDRLRRDGVHMAWLNSGGVQGYNSVGHAPATLEMLGVPYVGHDPLTATTLDNKHAFKREAVCAGLPTAPFSTWNMARGPFEPELNSRFQRAFGNWAGPFIVKPVSGRASLHVNFVKDRASLPEVVSEVYGATGNVVLIEQYLSGREFCIAVAGPMTSHGRQLVREREPFAFAALERILAPDEAIFTSMDTRPITNERFRPVDASRDSELLGTMRRLAREVFLEFNLESLVRLDLRADDDGKLYILEANPKPDLKRPSEGVTSLICAGLPEAGMDYDDLVYSLLADRLDLLFRHRRGAIAHIVDLLDSRPAPASAEAPHMGLDRHDAGRQPIANAAQDDQKDQASALVDNLVTDLNVLGLHTVLDAAKGGATGRKSVELVKPPRSRGAQAR